MLTRVATRDFNLDCVKASQYERGTDRISNIRVVIAAKRSVIHMGVQSNILLKALHWFLPSPERLSQQLNLDF